MDTNIPPTQPSSDNVADELRQLGQNLLNALRLAWQSDERKKFQYEMEAGLNDMANSLKQAANEFTQSSAGQNIKSEFEDFRQRVQSGEVEAKVRREVLAALQTANAELIRATEKQAGGSSTSSTTSKEAGGCDDCNP